tara:strand:+ start:96 stop:575 length:480 start_codon:yes stop_codon:yes gene_type:complete
MPYLNVRELHSDDLQNGFLTTLDALRPTSHADLENITAVFERLQQNPDVIVAVAEIEGQIIGTGTLHLLRKFLYGGSISAQIEDVAVVPEEQHAGIGRAVIDFLLSFAQSAGCYKTMLHCDDEVMPFYRKFGFHPTTNGMRFDHPDAENRGKDSLKSLK